MPAVSITDLLPTEANVLPLPDWAVAAERVRSLPDASQPAGWADAVGQWADAFARALVPPFAVTRGDGVLLVSSGGEEATYLHAHARHCRRALLGLLPGLARFTAPADEVVFHLPHPADYYAYLAAFARDGEPATSVGCHIRAGYPHTVLCGSDPYQLGRTLAHELTHAALHHLDAPAWIEEGITQLVEIEVAGAIGSGAYQVVPRVELTTEQARRHRRFWPRVGLGPFWWGRGFADDGTQQLSYELAAVLMTLLVEEHRPGLLFGFGRRKQQRFLDFLANARAADAGTAAAVEHLGYPLSELAAKFLGPGDWEPNPADADKPDLPTTE